MDYSEQDPPSATRLPDETPCAYRAFSVYRDFRPGRSLDKAWARFRTEQGKPPGSARHPGHWDKWSAKYNWVERVEADDDRIDEERRNADAERRQAVQEELSKSTLENVQLMQNRFRTNHSVLDKMATAPLNEAIQVKHDNVTGTTTKTKIPPINARDTATLTIATIEIWQALQEACLKAPEKEERVAERVVWIKAPPTLSNPQSGRKNIQKVADLDADLADIEADKAA